MKIKEKVEKVLKEKVDPILSAHFGGAMLSKLEDDVAWVKMTGGCAGCPSAQMTLEGIIKDAVLTEVPEVKDVKLDTGVSDDLINQANEILKSRAQ